MSNNLDDLKKLAELKKDGIITEDEFNAKKELILKQESRPSPRQDFNPLEGFILEKKSMAVAYVLCIFFGGVGAHRFYLKSYAMACTQLGLVFAAIIFAITGFGLIFAAITGFIALIDLFLIPDLIKNYNNKLMERLKTYKALTT